jgi:hypothetical protein
LFIGKSRGSSSSEEDRLVRALRSALRQKQAQRDAKALKKFISKLKSDESDEEGDEEENDMFTVPASPDEADNTLVYDENDEVS